MERQNNLKILSLFDGISCARVALERAGIKVGAYYASEVDDYAMKISHKNWPNITQCGDVKSLKITGEPFYDLLIGGSPCQDLSIAKKDRKGLDGERSGLFWEYVRILNEAKPKYFILENVNSMPKEAKALITETLGVEPVMINASLVSAQNRKRLFWVGKLVDGKYQTVVIPQPEDREILLKDILLDGFTDVEKSLTIRASYYKTAPIEYFHFDPKQAVFTKPIRVGKIGKGGQGERIYSIDGKSVVLSALGGGRGAKTGLYQITKERAKDLKEYVRKLHPIECERLQGLPDNYTEGVSNTQRYKCLGNAFNVDVVAHLLTNLK